MVQTGVARDIVHIKHLCHKCKSKSNDVLMFRRLWSLLCFLVTTKRSYQIKSRLALEDSLACGFLSSVSILRARIIIRLTYFEIEWILETRSTNRNELSGTESQPQLAESPDIRRADARDGPIWHSLLVEIFPWLSCAQPIKGGFSPMILLFTSIA